MSKIILVGINSTYQHTSLGLRYLKANLNEYENDCLIVETTLQRNPNDIAEEILKLNPLVLGFGVYIWNSDLVLKTIEIVKKIAPEIIIVLGGPEISYETETQEHIKWADHIICGEADHQFYYLINQLFTKSTAEIQKHSSLLNTKKNKALIHPSKTPEISSIKLPYYLYTEEDIKNRFIYVEASRGCPYKCEYCLSSLDKFVRNFELNTFLLEIDRLYQKGARQFKFIDRTFNLSPSICKTILNFFIERRSTDLFIHFEMVPDRLPDEIKPLIEQFDHGQLQFEVGIQTLNPNVAELVSRKNNLEKVKENFLYLKEKTKVHIHADLIAGLPGENLESFAQGFDQLSLMEPDEIQVGILKRLKGTPIARHEKSFSMVYSQTQPYQILSTSEMTFFELQFMQRFSKYWDLYANSGNFKNFMIFLKKQSHSYFKTFSDFVKFLEKRHSKTYGISLDSLFQSATIYLMTVLKIEESEAKQLIQSDYLTQQRTYIPQFMRIDGYDPLKKIDSSKGPSFLNKRQLKHSRE